MFCWLHIATVSAAYLLDCWGGIAIIGLIFIPCNVYYQGME